MSRRKVGDTLVQSLPPDSELVLLAELAFESRRTGVQQTHVPRNLVFLSPEALEMDLTDPMQRDFGDYELLEKIGRGGMGVVYRAHQKSLDREVALKLLIAGPWAPTRFIERFEQEAQSAARLEHPNIVTVYESGSQHDLNYFSMRLVRGESLATLLVRQGRIPPREAARLLRIVADAVDYAHRLGVLHLDLKPGNVLVDESGMPLVADFGLARRVDQALAEKPADASGTPSYMAPEQADGLAQRIGRATDIYGLGSILYEMLCERPPFTAATPDATLELVVSEEVQPPRRHDAGIPRDLEAICLKCLRKDPAERYATAADLAEDLRCFINDRPVSVRQPPAGERVRRWVRREPRLAAAVGAVALVLLIGLGATAQQWQRAEGNADEARQLIWDGRREAALRLEQEGQGWQALARLVSNVRDQEEAGDTDQAALERLRIGILRGRGTRLIDRMAVADANPLAVEVSPDGSVLALAFNDLSVRWYDADTLEERGRVSLAGIRPTGGGTRAPMLLRFVDEHRLRVTLEWISQSVSPNEGNTWLVDLDRAALVEPPAEFADFADACYSANGRWALLRNRAGNVQLWQTEPWEPRSALIEDGGRTRVWLLDRAGRFAFGLGDAMRNLTVHDLRGDSSPQPIELPGDAGVSAWMLSADGRRLALGDFAGRVFLLDVANPGRAPRKLQVLPGREIKWLAFSEDGAWLAVANFDGSAQVIDVATGEPLSSDMRSAFTLRRVGISHRQRLLVAEGDGETALWRIPEQGARARPAHRIGLAPAAHQLAGQYAIGWSLQNGLAASAGLDGQVRLWRLPVSPIVAAKSPWQTPERIHADGDRFVDTEWNRLRIVSRRGRALSRWRTFPQPPGYAELLDGDRLLLVTVGHELQGFDATSLRRIYEPVALPASPERMLASRDGRYVLLVFGGHGELGHEERLQLFDAHAGRRLPGEIVLEGPSRHFSFSPDQQWILAVGPDDGVTSVLRRDGLELVGEFPHDPFEPVVWADFRDDDRVLLVTRAQDARLGRDSLLIWNPQTDQIDARRDLGAAAPLGVIATAGGAVVAGESYDLKIGDDGESSQLSRIAESEPSEPSPVMAVSPNGRLVARANQFEVRLEEAATGAPLGPPLVSDIPGLDFITQVHFTADGRALLARSIMGRELYWTLDPETGAGARLQAEVDRLLPSGSGPAIVHTRSAAESRRLRAADPGPWSPAEARPAVSMASNPKPEVRVPARAEGASERLVDLGPVYDTGPAEETGNTYWSALTTLQGYPVGVQRIDGVDFDIRGIAQIGAPTAEDAEGGAREHIACLKVPAALTAAIRLLGRIGLATPQPKGETLARLTIHYLDGSEAVLPLRAGYELHGYADDDAVPSVLFTKPSLAFAGRVFQTLSAPRLENPHPNRVPYCLDLEVRPPFGPLSLVAITLEAPPGEAAVIRPAESGSISQREATQRSPAEQSESFRRSP